jgi:LuxR family transcriptional regulator, maltose regulon positive regulatory protein
VKTLRRKSTNQTVLVEISEAEWDVLSEREHRLLALDRALASVSEHDPLSSLQRIAKVLPLAASVEMVSIRLLSSETDELHLVAREGLPSRRIRDLALDPISVARQRSIFALGGHHSQARTLGLRYLAGEWLESPDGPIGSITIGSRTDRRPSPAQREAVHETAGVLGPRLATVDRSTKNLRRRSLELARAAILEPPDVPEQFLEALRPREATVLELYVDGRSVDEIAEVLVISPHTVRTHIKLAFRRLGVHSREEAAELVRSDRVMALL